ncbi:pyridoxal-dependent decarboxylase [Polyangium jinanense]|uniref:EF-hand domain-containing protein n=1 Tax=Polyangium jinanense TaxID=2829994 RepID=A0A9X4AYS5_9BACT|nr:pyridoxal-dependent decarboxylase [Polyangium jinanense]MDC3962611.1 EF-hand domain-containing protein [Polyangium jinanense]MDC3989061.1 EF-hand domain-containing protein [Polyangium jinanense]
MSDEKARTGRPSVKQYFKFGERPFLKGAGTRSPEAWFLGTKAENADELEKLIVEAIRDHSFWRRNFHPQDPTHITEQAKRHPSYLHAMDSLKDNLRSLMSFLKKSVPFFSGRYQGHMNWDTSLPSILGYFAAMLYNPNNVAFEGSTSTTILEMIVGDDLCRMLGYTVPEDGDTTKGIVRPWGHITSGGTVANIEAIWSARNLKFYPLSLRDALRAEPSLAAARDIEVSTCDGRRARLVALDAWSLLNLKVDDILALPERLTEEYGISSDTITKAMSSHSLQHLGMQELFRRSGADVPASPVILVPATKHYSFPKAAAVLGLGSANVLDVPVDCDARMSLSALEKMLRDCLEQRRPVVTVVGVIGSTEESAVDPLKGILELRYKLQKEGLSFTVHADAAWGGYFASILRPDEGPRARDERTGPVPEIGMSGYVTSQFSALGRADSITVDPHKSGYIPYPAGALCYRNSAMRDMVTFKAPYILHGDAEPTVGIYGLEGSKPGAAVAAVYLSHKVIRPTRSGYGQIHRRALFNCKRFYARLLSMASPEDRFVVVPVPRLPAEISGADVETERRFIRERIDRRSVEDLLSDPEAMAFLPEIGPDQNILTYAVNFRHPDGTLNTSLELANRLNKAIYDLLSIDPGDDIYGYRMIVSTTDFSEEHYGNVFIEDYKRRLGVASSPGTTVTVLRSTTMEPWILETPEGSMLDVLENELRDAIFKSMMRDSMFQIFEEIDANRDGVLDVGEVMAKFREKGYRDTEIDEFLRLCDIDRSGTVSIDEFLGAFSQFVAKGALTAGR